MQDWVPEEIPKPFFSLAERDRRWSRAREAMAKEKLDGLLAPAAEEEGTTLYLTDGGGRTKEAWVVFARDPAKPVLALVESNRVKSFWLGAQNWLGEENLRLSSANISESVILAIKELGLERGRIGVAQLTGIRFDPEGLIPFTTFERIHGVLPQASFIATDLLHRLRMIKSAEEIDVMKRIVAANEKAIVTL